MVEPEIFAVTGPEDLDDRVVREVMALVTAGRMNKQIADDLKISEVTVKIHRGSVMRKMEVRSLADLVRASETLGLPRST